MRNMLTRCRRRKEPNARPDRYVIGWPGRWAAPPKEWKLDPESALLADQNTLEWSIRHRGPESTMTLNAKGQVAVRLEQLGRYDEALQLRTEVHQSSAKSAGNRASEHAHRWKDCRRST